MSRSGIRRRVSVRMEVAKPRFQPAGERLIGQQRVEVHWRFRHAHAMAFGRNGRMQVRSAFPGHQLQSASGKAFDEIDTRSVHDRRNSSAVPRDRPAAPTAPRRARFHAQASSAGGSQTKVRGSSTRTGRRGPRTARGVRCREGPRQIPEQGFPGSRWQDDAVLRRRSPSQAETA